MAKIEDVMEASGGDWGGIEQITPTLRLGYMNDFLIVEKTLADGTSGIYSVPFIEKEHFEAFLAWKATLSRA